MIGRTNRSVVIIQGFVYLEMYMSESYAPSSFVSTPKSPFLDEDADDVSGRCWSVSQDTNHAHAKVLKINAKIEFVAAVQIHMVSTRVKSIFN